MHWCIFLKTKSILTDTSSSDLLGGITGTANLASVYFGTLKIIQKLLYRSGM